MRYSIEELKKFRNEEVVIYLNSRSEHNKLKEIFNLCDYYGAYCYSLTNRTYSSTSNHKSVGSYSRAQFVTFSQIDFQKELINSIYIW